MNSLLQALRLFAVLAALGAIGYVLYIQAAPLLVKPCTEPIAYHIAATDARFGITKVELEEALKQAETVWEEASGRDLFLAASGEGIAVNLIYGDVQRASELGDAISQEQKDYDAKKEEIEELKVSFDVAKRAYDRDADKYDELSAKYHEQVNYWNSQGGAPKEEYEELTKMREELERMQAELKERADKANDISLSINARVDELNAFARKLNAKVDVYNENAGDDFDQGDYQEDTAGKRINVYEFKNSADLRRVLAHEFGHALGIDHVENPSSIMYSYNAGATLELSEEDMVALRTACKLD